MTEKLDSISVPHCDIFHGNYLCNDDNYYCEIVRAILEAESCLPKTNASIQRTFWSEELSSLKQASIDCSSHWKSMGCPKSGPVFDCKKDCHYKYKIAIRRSKVDNERIVNENMYQDLVNHDSNSFWKTWNGINRVGNSIVSRIEGETDDGRIADVFANYFESVFSDHDSNEHTLLKEEFYESFSSYSDKHVNDDLSNYYLSWSNMMDIAAKIKVGKATAGSIRPEHFLHGCPELMRHFQTLFNGMIQHSFVPTEFLKGTVSPIVKDAQGDISDAANYRGITLSSLPSKLFEFALQMKIEHLLGTDSMQFGFKSKTSTNHALFTLQSTIDYFTKKGSNVYVAFLDCTKAFDRISHYGLFSKLIERNVPLCYLLCLMFWYLNMVSIVKWGSETSREFRVPLGVKQGGINSPGFFSVYFDGLLKLLRSGNVGCHIGRLFLASIFFADDICLIAPTLSSLQRLITISNEYCNTYGLSFNPKKSKIMVFSKTVSNYESLRPITLNGTKIDVVHEVKYLGTTIVSSPGFAFSSEPDLRSFYRAANSVLNVRNNPDKKVLMHLLYANCVHTLTYACAVKSFPSRELMDCNTALNDAIRKIFSFNRWDSVRHLRQSHGYKSITEIFATAKRNFLTSLPHHKNTILNRLYVINQVE